MILSQIEVGEKWENIVFSPIIFGSEFILRQLEREIRLCGDRVVPCRQDDKTRESRINKQKARITLLIKM